MVNVTWRDALAYVQWLAERTEQPYRLPTEAEWEKAARGEDGRLWPWGNDWDPARANCKPAGPGQTTPRGQYSPGGDSPYGAADMAGNVYEWCSSLWGDDSDKPLDLSVPPRRWAGEPASRWATHSARRFMVQRQPRLRAVRVP